MTFAWDDVPLFLSLMREKTLSAAARRLGVDASTVSRRLSTFESELKRPLFDRTRDGLKPTMAAEQLLPAAEEMERASFALRHDAGALETVPEGVVRLSCAPGIAQDFVAPALKGLRERHPKIRIDLDASQRVVDLTRREADIAIRSIRPESGDLVMTRYFTTPYRVMAAPALVKQLGVVKRWAEVPWVAWDGGYGHLPESRWLAQWVPTMEPIFKSNDFAVLLSSVAAGVGVGVVPVPYGHLKGLTAVQFARPMKAALKALPTIDAWLVAHRALRAVPRVDAVWTYLLERARQLEAVMGGR